MNLFCLSFVEQHDKGHLNEREEEEELFTTSIANEEAQGTRYIELKMDEEEHSCGGGGCGMFNKMYVLRIVKANFFCQNSVKVRNSKK